VGEDTLPYKPIMLLGDHPNTLEAANMAPFDQKKTPTHEEKQCRGLKIRPCSVGDHATPSGRSAQFPLRRASSVKGRGRQRRKLSTHFEASPVTRREDPSSTSPGTQHYLFGGPGLTSF
jgi:hypothetical protein